MRIVVYRDATIDLDLASLLRELNRHLLGVEVSQGAALFEVPSPAISFESSYEQLPRALLDESARFELAVMLTRKEYDNNWFFQAAGTRVIVSFAHWEDLTDLPLENGVVYFLMSMIVDAFNVGYSHDENTGCINDFWWDKRGVDVGMRAAFLCRRCYSSLPADGAPGTEGVLTEIETILDHLSRASRKGVSVLAYWRDLAVQSQEFDVFMCHHSEDKSSVRALTRRLREVGLRPWLDEEQLRPGFPWQDVLQAQIEVIKSSAVCIGPSGQGPWQNMEIRGFLSAFVERGCPVIPVIMRDAAHVPPMPPFLREFTWVDFRRETPDPMAMLRWGVTGVRVI